MNPINERYAYVHGYCHTDSNIDIEIVRCYAGDWMIEAKMNKEPFRRFFDDGLTYNQALCLAKAFIKVYQAKEK